VTQVIDVVLRLVALFLCFLFLGTLSVFGHRMGASAALLSLSHAVLMMLFVLVPFGRAISELVLLSVILIFVVADLLITWVPSLIREHFPLDVLAMRLSECSIIAWFATRHWLSRHR
jgi:hypothetical protein